MPKTPTDRTPLFQQSNEKEAQKAKLEREKQKKQEEADAKRLEQHQKLQAEKLKQQEKLFKAAQKEQEEQAKQVEEKLTTVTDYLKQLTVKSISLGKSYDQISKMHKELNNQGLIVEFASKHLALAQQDENYKKILDKYGVTDFLNAVIKTHKEHSGYASQFADEAEKFKAQLAKLKDGLLHHLQEKEKEIDKSITHLTDDMKHINEKAKEPADKKTVKHGRG